MKHKLLGLLIVMLLIPQTLLAKDVKKQDPPMVISVSWSSPDTRYLRLHIKEWEKLPLTGTLVLAKGPTSPEGGSVFMAHAQDNLSWAAFQRNMRFTPEMLKGSLEDLKQTKFTRSKDNFLWVVSYLKNDEHFDWFDDAQWENVLHNIEHLARLAKDGGLRGLVLDAEEYNCLFWSYGGSRADYALKNLETYKDKSWKEVRDRVRQRGQSFIQAVNKGYPGCLMWLLYGYSRVNPADPAGLSDATNGLYAGFIDGMLEASDNETVFIDGCEDAYGRSEPEEFMRLRKTITEKALKYTTVPEIYREKIRVGFGLYLDMTQGTWRSDQPNDNKMTPARLEKALRNALEISDGYVWIYSENPSWWLTDPDDNFGENVRLFEDEHHGWIAPAYHRAVKRAMAWYKKKREIDIKRWSSISREPAKP